MAKKKKKDEEVKYVFSPPEFDEKDYMQKELKKTKASIVTVIYAIAIAVLSLGLTLAGEPGLGALLGFSAMFMIRFVFQLAQVEFTYFEKKDWAGNGFIFFFTWLGVWVLLCNPPFTDLADPSIDKVEVLHLQDGELAAIDPDEGYGITGGENITISAKITDNVEVVLSSITIDVPNYGGALSWSRSGNTFRWQLLNVTANTTYTFTIRAKDVNGNAAAHTGAFDVQ